MIAIVALALGLGATTAIFSVVNAVLLRPLPFPEADRLVVLWSSNPAERRERDQSSADDFRDWRARSTIFREMSAWRYWGFSLSGTGEPEDIAAARVSPNFFSLLGVAPLRGRGFLPEEEQLGRDNVVVISHGLWRDRFGADERILERMVDLDGVPHRIVGVMPPGFRFPDDGDVRIWAPLAFRDFELRSRAQRMFYVLGRLGPDATIDDAQREMDAITGALAADHPATNRGWSARIDDVKEQTIGANRQPLLVLLGAVGFVLLIACANVANLFLSRAADRQREIAVRIALGAARGRIVRQLLAESVLIALAAGAAGVLIAMWGIELLIGLEPGHLPQWNEVRIDRAVLLFTGLAVLVTAMLSGLAPALHVSKPDLATSLKEGAMYTAIAGLRARVRHLLVVAEVALAVILLAGAGLLLRSFHRLQGVDPGFDAARLLVATIFLPETRYASDAKQAAFFEQLVTRVRALPGVVSAAAVTALPMEVTGVDHDLAVEFERYPTAPGADDQADFRIASDGYFATMGIPVIAGREFAPHDRGGAPRVAVINRVLASRLPAGENPVGQRILWGSTGTPLEVVGVVGEIRHRGLDARPRPELYTPYQQLQYGSMAVIARTADDPLALAQALKAEVYAIDPLQPVSAVTTMEKLIGSTVSARRFNMLLLGAFAALALVLSGVGVFGVISYSVSQRTREIGVRMALGARSRDVLVMVLRDGLVLAIIGVAIGLGGGVALTRLLENLLYEITPTDPLTYGVVAALIILVAAAASLIPARRAATVEAMIALRHE
jgi:putative ABC transport system permease protein